MDDWDDDEQPCYSFKQCCELGDFEKVRWMIVSSRQADEIEEDIVQQQYNDRFIISCKYGHLNIVKYLLTSPELTVHADVNIESGLTLMASLQRGQLDIAQYLVFEQNVSLPKDMEDYFKSHNSDFAEMVNMVEERKELMENIIEEHQPSVKRKRL